MTRDLTMDDMKGYAANFACECKHLLGVERAECSVRGPKGLAVVYLPGRFELLLRIRPECYEEAARTYLPAEGSIVPYSLARVPPRPGRYRVSRSWDRDIELRYEEPGNTETVPHVALHSPTGLEIGYGGSGPADLALSILADAFGASIDPEAYKRRWSLDQDGVDLLAGALHQEFKREWCTVQVERGCSITLSAASVYDWAAEYSRRRR